MTDKSAINPAHYKGNAIVLEPYELIKYLDGSRFNAMKYVIRYKDKHKDNPEEDLLKAKWYLDKFYEIPNKKREMMNKYLEPDFNRLMLVFEHNYCNTVLSNAYENCREFLYNRDGESYDLVFGALYSAITEEIGNLMDQKETPE